VGIYVCGITTKHKGNLQVASANWKMKRIAAIQRVLVKRRLRGATKDNLVEWLISLKFDMDCEFNQIVDNIIKKGLIR